MPYGCLNPALHKDPLVDSSCFKKCIYNPKASAWQGQSYFGSTELPHLGCVSHSEKGSSEFGMMGCWGWLLGCVRNRESSWLLTENTLNVATWRRKKLWNCPGLCSHVELSPLNIIPRCLGPVPTCLTLTLLCQGPANTR